jgi:hypothetical protein
MEIVKGRGNLEKGRRNKVLGKGKGFCFRTLLRFLVGNSDLSQICPLDSDLPLWLKENREEWQ